MFLLTPTVWIPFAVLCAFHMASALVRGKAGYVLSCADLVLHAAWIFFAVWAKYPLKEMTLLVTADLFVCLLPRYILGACRKGGRRE